MSYDIIRIWLCKPNYNGLEALEVLCPHQNLALKD